MRLTKEYIANGILHGLRSRYEGMGDVPGSYKVDSWCGTDRGLTRYTTAQKLAGGCGDGRTPSAQIWESTSARDLRNGTNCGGFRWIYVHGSSLSDHRTWIQGGLSMWKYPIWCIGSIFRADRQIYGVLVLLGAFS